MPDKTLEFKGVDCHGGKSSKERLTVLVCANMSGTEKIPLFVIGKSKNPRCFKNIKTLPTSYEANKKAWITSDLFTTWLRKLDKKFQHQRRNVAMVVDNCPAHPKCTGLKAIKLYFLPPNTTSKTQPMDQGIIQNLKVHYRKLVIMKKLRAIEKRCELTITVIDALCMLYEAWTKVTDKTIQNCFRHANFSTDTAVDPPVSSDGDEDPEDDITLAALRLRVPFEDYARVDENVTSTEAMTDRDIVENIIAARAPENEDDSDKEEPTETARKPPTKQVVKALELVRDWVEMTENTEDLFPALQKLERRVTSEDIKSTLLQQSCIKDCLSDLASDRDVQ
ncbi:tigger transposable element-derived protein 4-like [Saccostrea echinata]|uniref:tigger transposable element-derived protein 4-like n=1 Tax=Saccostrea echinata TaxID=191078 RepID=UPI002A83D297|nr:tigger transposable element-derived protein 4-like [Saccostrea echinata]